MKIAMICEEDTIGDADDLICDDSRQLCAALAAHGHDVTAYARRRDERATEIITEQGFRVVLVSVGPRTALTPRELPVVGDWAAALARMWSATPPDVVHGYGWLGGLAAQLAARQQRLPTVQTFHGLALTMGPDPTGRRPANTERARIEPSLARNAMWATGGCSAEVDELARLRRSRARVSLLAAGVDVQRYSPVGSMLARTDLHRVLCLEPDPLSRNGFDKMIRVLSRLPGFELVLAETCSANPGHDAERTGLKRLATELEVSDRVRFMGTVAADELPALLRSADVVACTPSQAPRATTALQGMASGVAVVAVSVGALTDTVIHSVTGLMVSPKSLDELAGALKSLQEDSFRREAMGATGRLRSESRFSWNRIALDALRIYDQARSLHPTPHVMSAS